MLLSSKLLPSPTLPIKVRECASLGGAHVHKTSTSPLCGEVGRGAPSPWRSC